ncbi:hypothetical protein [Microcoleus sp. FACHB-831]|nr:hypothetical protein [Microcoleus sp. FACHB-831]
MTNASLDYFRRCAIAIILPFTFFDNAGAGSATAKAYRPNL